MNSEYFTIVKIPYENSVTFRAQVVLSLDAVNEMIISVIEGFTDWKTDSLADSLTDWRQTGKSNDFRLIVFDYF